MKSHFRLSLVVILSSEILLDYWYQGCTNQLIADQVYPFYINGSATIVKNMGRGLT